MDNNFKIKHGLDVKGNVSATQYSGDGSQLVLGGITATIQVYDEITSQSLQLSFIDGKLTTTSSL